MKTLSTTELRKNLAETMDQVNDDHMPVIVTRAGGKSAVLISLEDYTAMDETMYLMSSPKNAERLTASIERLEKGEGTMHELIEE